MPYMVSVVHINDFPIIFPLIIPYQTAEIKRGLSCQNSIKTSHRNKLKENHLNVLVTNKTSKCSVADFGYELAINMMEKKPCRIYQTVSY